MTPGEHAILHRNKGQEISSIAHSRSRISLKTPLAGTNIFLFILVAESPREIYLLKNEVDRSDSWYLRILNLFLKEKRRRHSFSLKKSSDQEIPTELSMTSRMSYFNDRILQPEGIFL